MTEPVEKLAQQIGSLEESDLQALLDRIEAGPSPRFQCPVVLGRAKVTGRPRVFSFQRERTRSRARKRPLPVFDLEIVVYLQKKEGLRLKVREI